MRCILLLVAVLLLAGSARAYMVFTTPALNVTAVDGATFNVTSPACATTAVLLRCNVACGNAYHCPTTQRWDKTAIALGTNATLCTFVFRLPPGEVAAPWLLLAVAECT